MARHAELEPEHSIDQLNPLTSAPQPASCGAEGEKRRGRSLFRDLALSERVLSLNETAQYLLSSIAETNGRIGGDATSFEVR
jgi:hypothetical protein